MKFRKKPVVIEAFQMTAERRWDKSEWPKWLNVAWKKESDEEGAFWYDKETPEDIFLVTLEGVHKVAVDDWIIRGVKRELYPCKPDIFEATYELVKGD